MRLQRLVMLATVNCLAWAALAGALPVRAETFRYVVTAAVLDPNVSGIPNASFIAAMWNDDTPAHWWPFTRGRHFLPAFDIGLANSPVFFDETFGANGSPVSARLFGDIYGTVKPEPQPDIIDFPPYDDRILASLPNMRWRIDIGFRPSPGPHPDGPVRELFPNQYVDGGGTIDPGTWRFWEMDLDDAEMDGLGDNAGFTLNLQHLDKRPGFNTHALQVGIGANGKNLGLGAAMFIEDPSGPGGPYPWMQGEMHLNLTPIPEPQTYALLLAGMTALAFYSRALPRWSSSRVAGSPGARKTA